jgi:hypothetical protein
MLNDYKPTHDPNLDTFKVQYLLAASAVLAVIFPYKYTFSEVSSLEPGLKVALTTLVDSLVLFDLARIGCHSSPAIYAATDWRSRDNHNALSIRTWRVPGSVHPQLDLPLYLRRTALLRPHCGNRRHRPDGFVLGFLLHLLHKVSLSQSG